MKHIRRILLLLAVVLALASAALAQGKFALKDGDRVVFYGDRITDQRLYTTFVETYVVTRFLAGKSLDICLEFINLGHRASFPG